MNWARLSRTAGSRRFDELRESGEFHPGELNAAYRSLREEVLGLLPPFAESRLAAGAYDIEAGLTVFRVLGRHGFGVRAAADEGIWRYLSLTVFPDVVRSRWPEAPADRFWKLRSRIWLRAMWWFVYLSWQGDESATRACIQDMSTDDVVQLVERPGSGFRIELCRALMRAAGMRPAGKKMIRQLMKLNTATLVMIEPSAYRGGINAYAADLYGQLDRGT